MNQFKKAKQEIDYYINRDSISKQCSIEAWEEVKPKRNVRHNMILTGLKLCGRFGTSFDIEKCCALDRIEISRRMSELVRAGWVSEYSKTKINGSKRFYTVYKLEIEL